MVFQEKKRKSLLLRGEFIRRFKEGQSVPEIAREFGVSRNTVRKWVNRCKDKMDLVDRPRCGRSLKTTPDIDSMIVQYKLKSHYLTSAEDVKRDLNLNISAQSVRHRLRDAGISLSNCSTRKLTFEDDQRVIELAKSGQANSFQEIKEILGLNVANITIRRRLEKAGIYLKGSRSRTKK